MSTSLDALKELLRQQIADEAARDEKVRQHEVLEVEITRLEAAIARRAELIDRLGAPLAVAGFDPSTGSGAASASEGAPQPKRPPDPLSCRIVDYVNRNMPAKDRDLRLLVQSWTGRGDLWARQKLSNLSEDRGEKPRASRKRPYLLSFWEEGEKLYELSPYGRASLKLVEGAMIVLQKTSQKMTH
jgi:hypothetical protein